MSAPTAVHSRVQFDAIGELRRVFRIHVAALAASHGLDVEGDLASILPAAAREPPTGHNVAHEQPNHYPAVLLHDDTTQPHAQAR